MKRSIGIAAAAMMMFAAGCGSDDNNNNNNNGRVLIDVSGTISVHPVSWGINQAGTGAAPDFGAAGEVQLAIINPITALGAGFDPTVDNLAFGPLDIANCSTTANGPVCPWSFSDVDITDLTLGLVALVIDTRSTPQFETSNVGIFGSDVVTQLLATPADFTGAPLFAVTRESVDALSAFTNATATDMRMNGFIFGLTVTSEATGRNPVSDVTVMAADPGITEIVYPNDTYMGVQNATNSAGFFIGVGTAPSVVTPFTATHTGSETFTGLTAGTQAGSAFVLIWEAD